MKKAIRTVKKIVLAFTAALIVVSCCMPYSLALTQDGKAMESAQVLANTNVKLKGEDEKGHETWNLTTFGEKVNNVYKYIATFSIPIGAIGFVGGALKMLGWGSGREGEKEAEKGKKQMLYVLIAVAAIQLLPAVIGFAIDIASGYKWDPRHPMNIK